MGDLENLLPGNLKAKAVRSGRELVLPYAEALGAINIATESQIAVLGPEAFEAKEDGLLTVDLADASAYIPFRGDWNAFVVAMNSEAERWISLHRLGENHGYLLTTASEGEFASIKVPKSQG